MNAKEEFIGHIAKRKVIAAIVNYTENNNKNTKIVLKPSYSENDFQEFLKSLDFEYDPGYGAQYVYGTIWYNDQSWSERREYDGSEWWEYFTCPAIDLS